MNAKFLFATTFAVAVFSSTAAFAADGSISQGPLTRAEVKADLARAQADGSLLRLQQQYRIGDIVNAAPQGTPLTRAEVKADLARAEADGTMADMRGDYRTLDNLNEPQGGTVSRSEVHAEAVAATRAHDPSMTGH